ncbi:MAG: hypothetical protein R6X34_24745 [Chloroflexota bacterium]
MSVCKRGFIAFAGMTIFIGLAIFSNFHSGEGQTSILWGIPAGIILGIAMCLWVSRTHVLRNGIWEPKDPDAPFANTNGMWGPPLGVLIVNIISRYLDPVIGGFIFGCTGIWLVITVGYIVFHSCRDKPKQ